MKPNVKTRPKIWTNWSGSVRFTPREIALPATEEEMISLVRRARERGTWIRVMGSGHSFTPLVKTDSTLVSLDRMQGVQPVDPEERQVSVLGGTKLKALGASLLQQGWSPENLGDIDAQSIAGAVSTGTHGTGMRVGKPLRAGRSPHPDHCRRSDPGMLRETRSRLVPGGPSIHRKPGHHHPGSAAGGTPISPSFSEQAPSTGRSGESAGGV